MVHGCLIWEWVPTIQECQQPIINLCRDLVLQVNSNRDYLRITCLECLTRGWTIGQAIKNCSVIQIKGKCYPFLFYNQNLQVDQNRNLGTVYVEKIARNLRPRFKFGSKMHFQMPLSNSKVDQKYVRWEQKLIHLLFGRGS